MPSSTRRRIAQLVLAASALLLALGGAELFLRQTHDTLPSLEALYEAGWVVFQHDQSSRPGLDDHLAERRCPEDFLSLRDGEAFQRVGPAEGEPLRLWTLGDSVTAGLEVERHEAFPLLLAQGAAEATERPMELRNLGTPGASLCGLLRRLAEVSAQDAPDLLVLVLTSNDLEDHRVFSHGGQMAASPRAILPHRPALAWVVERSYLLNLAWFGLALRDLDAPDNPIWEGAEDASVELLQAARAVAEQQRVPLQVVLLASPGLGSCQPRADGTGRCAQLLAEQEIIGRALDRAELPFVDLRGLWTGVEQPGQGAEDFVLIHPDAAGHRRIAEALLPGVLEELQ